MFLFFVFLVFGWCRTLLVFCWVASNVASVEKQIAGGYNLWQGFEGSFWVFHHCSKACDIILLKASSSERLLGRINLWHYQDCLQKSKVNDSHKVENNVFDLFLHMVFLCLGF